MVDGGLELPPGADSDRLPAHRDVLLRLRSMPAWGSGRYFGLAPECRLSPRLRSSPGDLRRRAVRPTEASKAAVCYVRSTSTSAVHGVGAKRAPTARAMATYSAGSWPALSKGRMPRSTPAMASADFVLSLRQQLVRIDAPWLRSIRSEAPARTLSGGQRMRRPENENNVGQANGGDRRYDRH
jgi:hypothetical protein